MKKILIIIYVLIFVVLTYYVVTLLISRDYTKVDTKQKDKMESSIEYSTKGSTENSAKNDSDDNEPTNTIETTPENAAYDIKREDCDSNCININNKSEKEYCNQICGFSTIQNEVCDDLSALEKDYCLKDRAISEKDINSCSQIFDSGIKKQCQNRINEDFMDEVM